MRIILEPAHLPKVRTVSAIAPHPTSPSLCGQKKDRRQLTVVHHRQLTFVHDRPMSNSDRSEVATTRIILRECSLG